MNKRLENTIFDLADYCDLLWLIIYIQKDKLYIDKIPIYHYICESRKMQYLYIKLINLSVIVLLFFKRVGNDFTWLSGQDVIKWYLVKI